MYNHTNQYRCSIIRGKSHQRELDNLLPVYAMIIDEICPCDKKTFNSRFNEELVRMLRNSNVKQKTLNNHRTEIAGKLFGMYYQAEDEMYYASERTKKFIADHAQPAFFKDMCYKMQFPNGMSSFQTTEPHLNEGISLRPYPFIIKCLMLSAEQNVHLTTDDIGYYILNALDVLKGIATPEEVVAQIIADKQAGIARKVEIPEGKKPSFATQHIREQITYLAVANLIYIADGKRVMLNYKEKNCLDLFVAKCGVAPDFDMYQYDISISEQRKQLGKDWVVYFSKISDVASQFETHISALMTTEEPEQEDHPATVRTGSSTVEIGDEGERYVYEYEKKRVGAFNGRLANKVLLLGKTKGLGYDIQSVVAEQGDTAEFVKYIEVKSTKRVTAPDLSDASWIDTIYITRNEWVAAQQHKDSYSIYRVYFVRDGVVAYIMNNIYKKEQDGIMAIVPTMYRVDFSNSAIDAVMG